MANKILRLEFFFERRGDCHAMQVELLITMTPRLHVRSAPMSPKKRKQFPRKRTKGSSLSGFCKRSCRKIKREILSKHGSFFLANLEVIITRISTTKNRWNFRLLQQVLHFEQRIARQRECSLEKEKGKSARNLQDLD